MSLSHRGQEWVKTGSQSILWKVLHDLWDPSTNLDGFLSLGVAENTLMHEVLLSYIRKSSNLTSTGLTYGDGTCGSDTLRAAIASFLTKRLHPVHAIRPNQVIVTNGVSSAIEHLCSIVANPGDAVLLGQPFYAGFVNEIEMRIGVKCVIVPFGSQDPLGTDAVSPYEGAIKRCQANNQRVAALILCNPHNPLGRCYSRDAIGALMRMCQRHGIHLISDEIYALSVYRMQKLDIDEPEIEAFHSALTFEDCIDPALVHILWGVSKDFGANGLRLGCIVSQANTDLLKSLQGISIFSYISSMPDALVSQMLMDEPFVDSYIEQNQKALYDSYLYILSWMKKHSIEYARGANAGFYVWADLGSYYCQHHKTPSSGNLTAHVNDILIAHKVYLASGDAFGSEVPGWFRIVFSQPRILLDLALQRIVEVLGPLIADLEQASIKE